MRKVRDHYFHKAKKENYPARSVYKLQEANEKYGFLKKGKRILDLGCHPGSWSLYAASVIGAKGTVVGVDLKPTEVEPEKGHAEIYLLCYDVFSGELVRALRAKWPGFHVLLSDMAPRTTGSQYADHQHSLRLAERVLELADLLVHPRGTMYCKVFQGEDFPGFVQTCRGRFERVKIVKPDSSRRESREVFVLGQGFIPGRARKQAGRETGNQRLL